MQLLQQTIDDQTQRTSEQKLLLNLICVESSILVVGSTIGWLNKAFFGFVMRTIGKSPNVSSVNENRS